MLLQMAEFHSSLWLSNIPLCIYTTTSLSICLFQVHIIVILYLYTLQNDHHDKSSYHLAPYKVIIILLTIFPMLYITSLQLIYFITGSLYLLIPSPISPNPLPVSPLATTSMFSVSMNPFLFLKVPFGQKITDLLTELHFLLCVCVCVCARV